MNRTAGIILFLFLNVYKKIIKMEFLPSIEMFFSWLVTLLILFNLIILLLNIYFHFWGKKYTSTTHEQQNGDVQSQFAPANSGKTHKLMAVMGSGGHTSEMLKLLTPMTNDNICPVWIYVIAQTDKFSEQKVRDFEQKNDKQFSIKAIPRAREVGQSYFSSIWTTLLAAWHSLLLIWIERPDIVLSNGPAIGFSICLFARLMDLLKIHQSRIVFIESICRVRSLSLTGLLLYHLRIPHNFIVQWPELQRKYVRTEYIGRLI